MLVEVEDTGQGIARENLERIFDKFVQVKGTPDNARQRGARARDREGDRGDLRRKDLGRERDREGEHILVRPAPPVRSSPTGRPRLSVRRTGAGGGEERLMSAKASVLLVDDEQNILKTVRICLEAAGFDVTAFMNPVQALDAMQERGFDLAFFDLKMQPIDGMQLLREARQLAPEMTVVLMTAHGSIDSAVEAIKLGAYDYLQKPFEFSELQHFAEKVYEHHRLKSEVRTLKRSWTQEGTRARS